VQLDPLPQWPASQVVHVALFAFVHVSGPQFAMPVHGVQLAVPSPKAPSGQLQVKLLRPSTQVPPTPQAVTPTQLLMLLQALPPSWKPLSQAEHVSLRVELQATAVQFAITSQLAQARSLVAVGAAVWYWPALHVDTVAQTRSLVAVGATTWNCKPLHKVTGAQAPPFFQNPGLQTPHAESLELVQVSPLWQFGTGVQGRIAEPSKNSPRSGVHVNALGPVSVQALPPHGFGTQSSLSTQAPAALRIKPLAQVAHVSLLRFVQVTAVQLAMVSHALQVTPSS